MGATLQLELSDQGSCVETFPVRVVLSWEVEDALVEGVEIRVDSPDGALFSTAGRQGSSETGQWVTESTVFYLLSRPQGQVLATGSLELPSCEALRGQARRERALDLLAQAPEQAVRFRLSPPRLFFCGRPVERTAVRVEWDVSALELNRVEIYLQSTTGQLFASGGPVGEKDTREWVTDGMNFVLFLPELDVVAAEREFRIRPCIEALD